MMKTILQSVLIAFILFVNTPSFGQHKRAIFTYYQDIASFNELPRSCTVDGTTYQFNNMSKAYNDRISTRTGYRGYSPQIGSCYLTFDYNSNIVRCHDDSNSDRNRVENKPLVFEIHIDEILAIKESFYTDSLYNAFLKYNYNMYKIQFHRDPALYLQISSSATYKYSQEFQNYQLIASQTTQNSISIDYRTRMVKIANPLSNGYVLNNRANIINFLPKNLTLKDKSAYSDEYLMQALLELTYKDSKLGEGWLVIRGRLGGDIKIYVSNYLHVLIFSNYKNSKNDFGLDYIREKHNFDVSLFNITNFFFTKR